MKRKEVIEMVTFAVHNIYQETLRDYRERRKDQPKQIEGEDMEV